MNSPTDLAGVVSQFQIPGTFATATPHGSGHINNTYCATFTHNGGPARYILQHINHHVFKNPAALMSNVQRVTEHLGRKAAAQPDAARRVPALVPARDGSSHHCDAAGNYWRVYHFIPKARSYDTVETPAQAYAAARAFGEFQRLLADLPAPRLHDTIPDFHHTPKRFAALEQAIAADAAGRVAQAQPEIEFALAHRNITGQLLAAGLPERITHNDTKLNNVLIDDTTGEGLCVIDLDTVMPGLVVYDFGDMVRTATSPTAEDERDLSRVHMQFPLFEALARGYLASAGAFLTREERRWLAFSGKLITFEIGIRFLADYLAGDTYFKVHRENQNLDRCRTQFQLVRSIAAQEARMSDLVAAIA
ncbi:MAG TPA: aminoglycoside phosphotransferase family protein [Dongiaceae bacterium]|nr:aminoglycoside phosphotransferase family protein [Dongiaceae bacterium]